MKTFGQPGSITPASFTPNLHPATVVEGLALLREMGLTRRQMSNVSGFSERAISRHLTTPTPQIRLPDGRATIGEGEL